MYDVTALGELLIDFTAGGKDSSGSLIFTANPGGAPANFLAALSKCGKKTAFIGKVGNDTFGDLLVNTVKDNGIDTNGIIKDENYFTTLAFVSLNESGDRSFSFARKPGADIMLKKEELYTTALKNTKFFHFGTLSMTNEPSKEATKEAIKIAKENGAYISFDPNYRAPLWKKPKDAIEAIKYGIGKTDILKISDEEVELLGSSDIEAFSQELIEKSSVKLIFITCGKKGSYYRNKNSFGFVSSFPVKTIDTNGAGDIFGGSALNKVIEINKAPDELTDDEMREISLFANAMASLSTTKHGAIPSIPESSEAVLLY